MSTLSLRRADRWLFVLALAIYLLASGGHTTSPDEEERYYVARGLVEQRRLAVAIPGPEEANVAGDRRAGLVPGLAPVFSTAGPTPPPGPLLAQPDGPSPGVRAALTGRPGAAAPVGANYSKYGLGGSLVQLPFYLAGAVVARLADPARFELWTRAAVCLVNPLATALLLVVLARLSRRLGATAGQATALALAAGLATPLLVYSRSSFVEPLVALGLLGAMAAAVGARLDRWAPGPWVAGGALGGCLLLRLDTAIVLPIFGLYLLWPVGRPGARRGEGSLADGEEGPAPAGAWLRLAVAFGTGPALALLVVAAYNAVRFGSPLETGYGPEARSFTTPLQLGLYGLVASPGRGLLVYAPPVWLALVGARRFARRWPRETALISATTFATILFFARWGAWHGGAGWGPRLLVPVLPMLLLLALPVFAGASWNGSEAGGVGPGAPRPSPARRPAEVAGLWLRRLAVAAALAVGLWVQLAAVVIQFASPLASGIAPGEAQLLYDRRSCPIGLHWRMFGLNLRFWRDLRNGQDVDLVVLEGLDVPPHAWAGSALPAWTAPRLRLRVPRAGDGGHGPAPARLTLLHDDYRPPGAPVIGIPAAWIEGQAHTPVSVARRGEQLVLELGVAASGAGSASAPGGAVTAVVEIPPWVQPPSPSYPAPRPRGIHLAGVELDGVALRRVKARPPPPASHPRALFEWFYRPELHHFDLWAWLAIQAGLPRLPVLLVAALLAAVVLLAAARLGATLLGTGEDAPSPTLPDDSHRVP